MKKRTKKALTNPTNLSDPDPKKPLIEHLYELRRRLSYVALAVTGFTLAGYFIQQRLVTFLLKPAKGQQFIYTTPTGGLNFLFQVCLYFGITLSIPVIIYQILRYIEPLLASRGKGLIARYAAASWGLALGGAAFGYYVGLPVALSFLSHQFTTTQIKPLLTIQEYMSFVTIYLLGSALLFQIPLILLFINRIRPLPPKKLLGFERYFIALAFIAAAVMTPTTDILNQLLFVGPILAVYQLSILLIYVKNRRSKLRPAAVNHQPESPVEMIVQPAVLPRPTSPIIRPLAQPGGRVWDIALKA